MHPVNGPSLRVTAGQVPCEALVPHEVHGDIDVARRDLGRRGASGEAPPAEGRRDSSRGEAGKRTSQRALSPHLSLARTSFLPHSRRGGEARGAVSHPDPQGPREAAWGPISARGVLGALRPVRRARSRRPSAPGWLPLVSSSGGAHTRRLPDSAARLSVRPSPGPRVQLSSPCSPATLLTSCASSPPAFLCPPLPAAAVLGPSLLSCASSS